MKYLKLFESFDAFNNPQGYLDMKHFEEFFSEEELKSMIANLEDILVELTDMGYIYSYSVDDVCFEFDITIVGSSLHERIDPSDIEDVLFRIMDFMNKDWHVSINGKFFTKNGYGTLGAVNKIGDEFYIEGEDWFSGKFKMPLKDVNKLYQITFNFMKR